MISQIVFLPINLLILTHTFHCLYCCFVVVAVWTVQSYANNRNEWATRRGCARTVRALESACPRAHKHERRPNSTRGTSPGCWPPLCSSRCLKDSHCMCFAWSSPESLDSRRRTSRTMTTPHRPSKATSDDDSMGWMCSDRSTTAGRGVELVLSFLYRFDRLLPLLDCFQTPFLELLDFI